MTGPALKADSIPVRRLMVHDSGEAPLAETFSFVTECQICHQPLHVTIHNRAEYVCSPCFWKAHPEPVDPLREFARKLLKWLRLIK